MRTSPFFAVALSPLAVLAAPTSIAAPPTRVLAARQRVVTPPPCVAISPPPDEASTKARHEIFAKAFLVEKNLTHAFEYISSTYINHNPYASANGPDAALDALGPIWPSTQITILRTTFKGTQGWLNYRAGGIGEVVDRYRWEAGCIVEHWDQGEKYPTT